MENARAFETSEYNARIGRIRQQMHARGADALIVDASEFMAYFSGFDTSVTMYRALVIPASGEPVMILRELDEGPYLERSWLSEYVTFRDWDDELKILTDFLRHKGFADSCIAVDLQSYALTVARYEALKALLPKVRFIDMSDELMRSTLIKSEAEIGYQRKAAKIVDGVMRDTIEWARVGVSPRDTQAFASAAFFKHGADHSAVGPITAGTAGHFLHGLAHDRPLHRGEILHVELVPRYGGYSSRMMRSIVLGAPTQEQEIVFAKLVDLQDRQFEAIRPGAIASEVDAICRQGALDTGLRTSYNNLSAYTLGYYPAPTTRGSNFYRAFHPEAHWPLEAFMVFHAYVSAGGLAISETILVTPTGCERLTQTDRKLYSKQD